MNTGAPAGRLAVLRFSTAWKVGMDVYYDRRKVVALENSATTKIGIVSPELPPELPRNSRELPGTPRARFYTSGPPLEIAHDNFQANNMPQDSRANDGLLPLLRDELVNVEIAGSLGFTADLRQTCLLRCEVIPSNSPMLPRVPRSPASNRDCSGV